MLLHARSTLNHYFICGTQKQSRAIIRVKAVIVACKETEPHIDTCFKLTNNGFDELQLRRM